MDLKKYRFISDVKINDPDYQITSQQLDYFTERDKAFFYGKTSIKVKNMTSIVKKVLMIQNYKKVVFKKMQLFFIITKKSEVTAFILKMKEIMQQLQIILVLLILSINQ